jgi:hypothetical protein
MVEKKQVTWEEIEADLRASFNNAPGETDQEKLEYFRKLIIGHLDSQQEEIEKKNIIAFPTGEK